MVVRIAAKSTTAGTPVKSYKITRAGLKGTSISCSEVSFQLRMFSTSAAKRYFVKEDRCLTLDVEVITVTDGRLEEHTDAVGQLVR